MKRHKNIKKCVIKIDDTGVGGGVTDRLREVISEQKLPYHVIPVNNGAKAKDKYYLNKGAESWGYLAELLEENMTTLINGTDDFKIELPDDKELIKQLSNRRKKISSNGKLQLESKKEMKKRGVDSPDTADAVVLAVYEPNTWIF